MTAKRTLSVGVPRDLLDAARDVLAARGLDAEDYVRLALRALVRGSAPTGREGPPLGLSDPMPFPKYAGEPVGTVVRADPRYVRWLLENIPDWDLDEEAHALLRRVEATAPSRRRRVVDLDYEDDLRPW